MKVDMCAAAITTRLSRAAALSDLRTAHRLDYKVDMSAEAITRRLRIQSQLRRACLEWGRSTPVSKAGRPHTLATVR